MERSPQTMVHAVEANTLADILERVLDKGIVIAGDIKIKLVDVELLTIQIRLLIASVERAKEMGIDWWESSPFLSSKAKGNGEQKELINALKQRIERLENNVIRPSREVE
jgi:nucleotide-binding universal stress UspA family protein